MKSFTNPIISILCLIILSRDAHAIQCYKNLTSSVPEDCTKSGQVVYNVQNTLAGLWKGAKDGIQSLTGQPFIDNLGDKIKEQIGLDLTNHEQNSDWVQNTMKKFGVNFDLSANCWVSYKRETGETIGRGCGAAGEVGSFGAKLVDFLQGNPFNVLAGYVCFSVPGNKEHEVCICKEDGCNEDRKSAKEALGIQEEAESIECGGKECPVTDLSRVINDWTGFNTACYTKLGGDERCFSTQGIFDKEAVTAAKLTMSARNEAQIGEYRFSKQTGLPGGVAGAGPLVTLMVCCLLLIHTLRT